MRFLTSIICVVVCGVALGSALTWVSVQDTLGFGALRVGQWTAWPDAGSANVDPYTDARIAVDGKVPLGGAEGVLFTAIEDEDGEALRRQCDYRISGRMPPSRYWTLTAQDSAGSDITDRLGNVKPVISEYGLWNDGRIDITVGAVRRGGGSWLASSGRGAMQLSLHLYDAQVTGTGTVGEIRIPTIERLGCAA